MWSPHCGHWSQSSSVSSKLSFLIIYFSQGTFNENLRRSFDKSTSSPVRSPGKKAPRRRKNSSQVLSSL